MSSLNILTIDLRIKTLLNKLIHTVIYKNTPTYLTDLLHLQKCYDHLETQTISYLRYLPSTENNMHVVNAMVEELFGIWLHLRGIIFQTIYGNQPYIEEAIYLKITLRNMFI